MKIYNVVPHRCLGMEYIRTHNLLYHHMYRVLDKMGLIPFLQYNKGYNEDPILQFYAVVYFQRDSGRQFMWRLGGATLEGSMSDLATTTGNNF